MILKDHFVWIDVQKKGAIYHITYRGMIEKEKQQRSGSCIIAKKAGNIMNAHKDAFEAVLGMCID